MAKRKDRTLKELYNATEIITESEITPVLRGSCRMQGPVDGTDHDICTNTVSPRFDEGFNRHSKTQKVHVRAEPGTCNVCFAPCSSCFHINRALMSKTDESSDENCRENTFSCSVNDIVTTAKSTTCEIVQHTAGKRSNFPSVNSSHDSFSENEESKASLRTSDVSGASEDVEISPKWSSGGTVSEDKHTSEPECDLDKRFLINKYEDLRGLKGHSDNILCLSRVNDAKKFSSSDIGNIDRINQPRCSASANSLVSEEYGKTVPFQTASECLDIHCDIEGSPNNSSRQSNYNEESIQKVNPPISLSSDLSGHCARSMENPSLKDTNDCTGKSSIQIAYSNTPIVKSLSFDPSLKDLEVDSCSRILREPPECSREHLNCLSTREVVSDTVRGSNSASYTCEDIQNSEVFLVGGNSEASVKTGPKFEAETDNDADDLPSEALNFVEQNQAVEKVRESLVLPDAKETTLQSHPADESDESDIVEHDVKVCDICGDAGREDFLAVCCRCSDGAEHTYCMREMVDKVPEGDWLCEECKFDEEIKNQKQQKISSVDGIEKDQFSGQADAEVANPCVKLDAKGLDLEGIKTNKDRSSAEVSKRHADYTEVSSTAKRKALEPTMGSPKTSSPSRIGSLSRDNSFKNLDGGKVKLNPQFPPGPHSGNDPPDTECSPTTGPRVQTPGGAFLKSYSFNFSNAKPKVKLVDEVVPQKQKSTRVPASLDTKEGAVRVIGKSMSFKSTNPGRLNAGEPKVKMLSPKISHVQDPKGLKHIKERNVFERKYSFKSDRPLINSTMVSSTVSTLKVDQNLASRHETVSLSSTSNNRELKAVQSDSKAIIFSKPTNQVIRRGSEMPVPLGEVKRQLSCLPNVIGASSANGNSSVEQKPIQASLKDDYLSNSFTAEKPRCNVYESLTDGLPRPQESINLAERIKENSITPCQKWKEIGHPSQVCTVDSPRSLALDASAARSSREMMNNGNKLKAAIEAAMLKKPGIYRKNRVPDQSDQLSVSSMNYELASQDHVPSSSNMRNMISSEDVNEGQAVPRNSNADSSKQITCSNVQQFIVLPVEAVTTPRTGDANPIVPSNGKPFMTELGHTSAAMSVLLKISAIPEHDCKWQGSFEVHRSGKNPELFDGFQAHLSTCASPRVLEAVNKFPRKVLLNVVPRLSTWPTQFEEGGVKEDNIALYFFAKDLGSYEKRYKILLESMTRSDLALKGNIDGVDLLIFPSNQLPQKSQRWNMFFFLWGVFRGKRLNCLQQVPGSPKKFCIPQDIPTAIMSLPENTCSLGPTDKDIPTCDRACNVTFEAPALIDFPCLSSTETINGDCGTKVSSRVPKHKCAHINVERQDCRWDSNSLSPVQTSSVQSCLETRRTDTSLEGHDDSDCKLSASVQVARTVCDSNRSEKMPMHWNTPLDRLQASSYFINKVPAGAHVAASVESVSEENILHRMNSCKDRVKFTRNSKVEGLLDAEVALEESMVMRVPIMKELDSWHSNHRKRPYVDPTEMASKAAFAGTIETIPWNDDDVNGMLVDGGSESKKKKIGFGGLYGCNDYTSFPRDGFASQMHDVASNSSIKEKRCEEACDEAAISKNSGNAERYFFPVDPRPVKDSGLGDESMPWIEVSSDDEDGLRDRAPNLELALGGETKPSKPGLQPFLVGKVDKRLNHDQPPDKATTKEEDDDISASLSLSLSFPFPDRNQAVKKTEQLLPERRHDNPSLLFFGGLSDK